MPKKESNTKLTKKERNLEKWLKACEDLLTSMLDTAPPDKVSRIALCAAFNDAARRAIKQAVVRIH